MSLLRPILCAVLLLLPCAGAAQELGVKAGLTLANVNISEPGRLPPELQWCCSPWDGTRHDLAVGVYAGRSIRPGVALEAELLFTQRGFNIGAGLNLPGARLRMSYVEAPILVQYVGRLVRIYTGPAIGFAAASSQWSEDVSRGGDFLSRNTLAKMDVSLVVGASLHRGRMSLDGRYVHGLRNVIRNAPTNAGLRHKSLMLLLGFRLAGPGPASGVAGLRPSGNPAHRAEVRAGR